ncbi:hypothetical protein GCM10025781_11210 [Kocuria gwangalliensis]|uniref:Uncharacterized protein n=1 Tax=Kocuria gwangalliensis TaxID=501592 RepID=A0ABP8WTF0_9MICC
MFQLLLRQHVSNLRRGQVMSHHGDDILVRRERKDTNSRRIHSATERPRDGMNGNDDVYEWANGRLLHD